MNFFFKFNEEVHSIGWMLFNTPKILRTVYTEFYFLSWILIFHDSPFPPVYTITTSLCSPFFPFFIFLLTEIWHCNSILNLLLYYASFSKDDLSFLQLRFLLCLDYFFLPFYFLRFYFIVKQTILPNCLVLRLFFNPLRSKKPWKPQIQFHQFFPFQFCSNRSVIAH
jgi:hypothetical protein